MGGRFVGRPLRLSISWHIHFYSKMIYSRAVTIWIGFALGLLAGAGITALWLRARIARLEAEREFAENSAAKLGETFQSLADAALRSNQTAFLDAARAQLTGDLA